jgi:hypothetical protein
MFSGSAGLLLLSGLNMKKVYAQQIVEYSERPEFSEIQAKFKKRCTDATVLGFADVDELMRELRDIGEVESGRPRETEKDVRQDLELSARIATQAIVLTGNDDSFLKFVSKVLEVSRDVEWKKVPLESCSKAIERHVKFLSSVSRSPRPWHSEELEDLLRRLGRVLQSGEKGGYLTLVNDGEGLEVLSMVYLKRRELYLALRNNGNKWLKSLIGEQEIGAVRTVLSQEILIPFQWM